MCVCVCVCVPAATTVYFREVPSRRWSFFFDRRRPDEILPSTSACPASACAGIWSLCVIYVCVFVCVCLIGLTSSLPDQCPCCSSPAGACRSTPPVQATLPCDVLSGVTEGPQGDMVAVWPSYTTPKTRFIFLQYHCWCTHQRSLLLWNPPAALHVDCVCQFSCGFPSIPKPHNPTDQACPAKMSRARDTDISEG